MASPTEAEIQTQWKNIVDVLEDTRVYADDTLVGLLDTLVQSYEGEYIPHSSFATDVRAALSAAVDPATARAALEPVVFEYARILDQNAAWPGGVGNIEELVPALFKWLHDSSATIATRNITYATPSAAGGNTGTLTAIRLTEDRYGYDLEACHVEQKTFRCVADQNSGAKKWAELWDVQGIQRGPDALSNDLYGSGESERGRLRARHAGAGAGGSILNNSSFSEFTASVSSGEQFKNWAETLTGSAATTDITQDTTNYYRSHPNADTDGALKIAMDDAGDSITLKQTLANMRTKQLDPDTPYFLRVMWNRSIGSGASGTVSLKLGSNTAVTATVAAQSGWQELVIPFDSTCWLDNFGENDLDIEIGWSGGTGGYVLFDDAVFCKWDQVDGTYFLLTENNGTPVPSEVNDSMSGTDSGGAAGTGKLQYWWWKSGLGHLPSSGSPTITDP